jgi:integrase
MSFLTAMGSSSGLDPTDGRYLDHSQLAAPAEHCGPTKSHARRWTPVPGFLRDDLAQHLAGRAPDEFVFPSQVGTAMRVDNFRRNWFHRAAVAAGLPGLAPHELRHTAASLASPPEPPSRGCSPCSDTRPRR